MSMNVYTASQQWSTRPEDERFTSLQQMRDASFAYAQDSAESRVPFKLIRVEAMGPDVQISGRAGYPAKLTHWAFGQLCSRVGAPCSYIRELPATLAAQNINHGLAKRNESRDDSDTAQLLFHHNGGLVLRSVTSEKYERIWNWEVIDRLLVLQQMGWRPANEIAGAIASWSKPEDVTAPLYASDHDMFAFICHTDAAIVEKGSQEPLYRGVIVENSEVGASSLKMTRFLYRWMCGNHIIWGASRVTEIRVRHVGRSVREKFYSYEAELRRYANEAASLEEAKIASAKTVKLGNDKEQVLDRLFGIRNLGLSRKVLDAGYDATLPDQDGDPNTQWGIVQGLTRFSQTIPFADQRTDVDRAAGKIMQIDF